jgi:polysaccharide biosynthesis transport protein
MTSRDRTQSIPGGHGGPAPGGGGRWDEQTTPFHTLLVLWRRHCRLILAVAALGTALATAAGLQVEPRFTATTAVMIAPRQSNIVDTDAVLAGRSAPAATVESEIKLIQARDYAALVVRTLSLDQDPELNPRNGNGDLAFTVADLWRVLVGWLPGGWLIATGLAEQRSVQLTETRTPSLDGVLDHFARRLQVHRNGHSHVISISFTSTDPAKAATIANEIAELYVEGQLAAKRSATTRVSDWLRDRAEVLRDELERSEQAVARYRAQHDLLDDGIGLNDQELAALQRELILAQAEFAARQARRELIAAAGTDGAGLKAIPEVTASPHFADLWRQESELQRIEGELGTVFGEHHPRMRSLAADKASLAAEMETAIARTVGNIARETKVIEGRIGALKKQLALVKGPGAESRTTVERLRELEREADASRQMYQTVLRRHKEAREQRIVEADAQIIARATPPLEPNSPGPRLFAVFGFAGSSLLGVLLALLVERSDRGIRSARQLEAYFGLPCLAVCPRLPRAVARQGTPAHEYLLERPLSAYAESMRALQLALRQTRHDRLPQVVQVTSAVPAEDKSALAFSLAASLAQNGKRVLLFELDLRRPRTAERSRATAATPADGPAPLFSEIRHDQLTGVDLILVNRAPAKPQAILTSAALAGVVRRLRQRYDHVVVDSAPLLGLGDGKFVSSLVDATILAIRWQSTPLDVLRDAIDELRTVSAPLLGAVITEIDIGRQVQYGYGWRKH